MKLTAEVEKEFAIAPAGTTACRAIRTVDLGTQETSWEGKVSMKRQVCITWEIAEEMEDGKPFTIQEIYTASIGDKSNLGKLLNAWRGRNFTDDERAGFELSNILGVPGLMSIEHRVNGGGKEKARVGSIIPLPKGMEAPEQFNESFKFDIDEVDDVEKLKQLWGLERFVIEKSEEFKLSDVEMPEREQKEEAPAQPKTKEQEEEEAPF